MGKGTDLSALISEDELVLVRSTALFGGLPDDLLAAVLKAGSVREAGAGEILFMQGDIVSASYIVLEGWVKLYRLNKFGDEAVVAVFTRGQSFAEAAVFSMESYPVAAEAVTSVRLLRVPSDLLLRKVKENSEFAFAMLASTSMHLQGLVRQIEQLKTNTATQRVARFLASLCPVKQGSCTIGLPYDKALIAGRLGMKPESLSRAFARLRHVGVRVEQSAAAIADVERLRGYASEDRSEIRQTRR